MAEAKKLKDFSPSTSSATPTAASWRITWRAKDFPDLRAVASLAGTSYVEDSSCDGAPPVSVRAQIHGTADEVIRFDGDATEPDEKSGGEQAFYASATDMVTRWSQIAGCNWPENPEPYATLDLDQYVPGSETQTFRVESGCPDGINIELWVGEDSSHSPGLWRNFPRRTAQLASVAGMITPTDFLANGLITRIPS